MADDPKVAYNKMLKRFLTQKSVLDTLRSQMDLSGGFLSQMKDNGTLRDEEVESVKSLAYPQNRNELLQILIRKQWTEESFQQFCSVLSTTNGENLSTTLLEKVSTYSKASTAEREKAEATVIGATRPPSEIIKIKNVQAVYDGGELAYLNMKQQNVIRLKLKERDDLIIELKKENDKLSVQLEQVTIESTELKAKHMTLDKAVQEMIARLSNTFGEDDTVAVHHITETFIEDRDKLTKVSSERDYLKRKLDNLQRKHDVITKEHEDLERSFEALQNLHTNEKEEGGAKIQKLQNDLTKAETRRNQLQRQVDGLQGMFGDSIRCLEHDLAKATRELREKTIGYDEAVKERNFARKEIKEVKERIRKLLFTLGLTNDIGKVGMSLEHARNISYAIRRNTNPSRQRNDVQKDVALNADEMDTLSEIMDTSKTHRTAQPTSMDTVEEVSRADLVTIQTPQKEPVISQEQVNKLEAGLPKKVAYPPGGDTESTSDALPGVCSSPSGRTTKVTARDSNPAHQRTAADIKQRMPPITLTVQSLSNDSKPSLADATDLRRQGPNIKGQNNVLRPSDKPLTPRPGCNPVSKDLPTSANCVVCGKSYFIESNYEGSCLHHKPGAKMLNQDTALEVWSCCRSQDTLKGCQKSRHQPAHN